MIRFDIRSLRCMFVLYSTILYIKKRILEIKIANNCQPGVGVVVELLYPFAGYLDAS